MKLTHTRKTTRKAGMTLLELTVVIVVLLSLISVLFIGARAWKKGADRSGCIMNIRNWQQAVRSHANMNAINPGTADANITLTAATTNPIVGDGKFMQNPPTCPGGGTYTAFAGVPAVGTVALTCNFSDGPAHAPTGNTSDW